MGGGDTTTEEVLLLLVLLTALLYALTMCSTEDLLADTDIGLGTEKEVVLEGVTGIILTGGCTTLFGEDKEVVLEGGCTTLFGEDKEVVLAEFEVVFCSTNDSSC